MKKIFLIIAVFLFVGFFGSTACGDPPKHSPPPKYYVAPRYAPAPHYVPRYRYEFYYNTTPNYYYQTVPVVPYYVEPYYVPGPVVVPWYQLYGPRAIWGW